MTLPAQIRNVVSASRKWAFARERCRAVHDSKSAKPDDLEKAKKALSLASDELFSTVRQFEMFLRRETIKGPRQKSNVNWGAIFGAIANGAKFLEGMAPSKDQNIIDTTGE